MSNRELIEELNAWAENQHFAGRLELSSAIAKAAEALEDMEWRPIEEVAPCELHGRDVLLWWNGKPTVGFYLNNSQSARPWRGWRVLSGRATPPGKPSHVFLLSSLPSPQEGGNE